MSKRDASDENFNANAYRDDLVDALSTELLGIFQAEMDTYGEAFADELFASLLEVLIRARVAATLVKFQSSEFDRLDDIRRLELTCESYAALKRSLESAIASGFAGGFHLLDPTRFPDFEVSIKPLDNGVVPAQNNS